MKKLLWVLILLLLPLTVLAEDAESHRDGVFFYQIEGSNGSDRLRLGRDAGGFAVHVC